MWSSSRPFLVGAAFGLAAAAGVYVLVKATNKQATSHQPKQATKRVANAAQARDTDEKMMIDYNKLAPAISDRNPQLVQLLMLIREKSAFKNNQLALRSSECLKNVNRVLWCTKNTQIKVLCLKILTNISTNPDMLAEFIRPVIYLVCGMLEDMDEMETESPELLPAVLGLLVNVTSHDDVIISEYNLRTIPQILSRYTPQINYKYEVVLSSLKILINMTCSEMNFDLTLVYMTSIHLLHGCRNQDVLLRVVTLLRNVLRSKYLSHDHNFDDELLRATSTLLERKNETEVTQIAKEIHSTILKF